MSLCDFPVFPDWTPADLSRLLFWVIVFGSILCVIITLHFVLQVLLNLYSIIRVIRRLRGLDTTAYVNLEPSGF